MYRYDAVDRLIVEERVAQYRDQVRRYLAGLLDEDAFKPLRLQNGLYIQRYAPMLRVAIPYGVLSSEQLRAIAAIARRYDRGVGHFTTRQNIQFNWVKVEETPDILAELARVSMHAIQTSGSCVRNVTTDAFAGVAADEIVDPRPYCELMRQWSTLHPEFAHLPRKFKVAFNGAREDRAATSVHDLAFDLYRDEVGEVRMIVKVGGGQGRTPRLADVIKRDLHWSELLTYSEAVLRAYNRLGRRDNIFKSRIKILVDALGAEQFAAEVDEDWAYLRNGPGTLTEEALARVRMHFDDPVFDHAVEAASARFPVDARFREWTRRNITEHRDPRYAIVTISLKRAGVAPGDVTADEMEVIAGLAERYSAAELRVAHTQNLVLPYVRRFQLHALWLELDRIGLARANIGLASDIISCPGGDFCSLANAKSIPLSAAIAAQLAPIEAELGPIAIKVSGCINACGHHHVGHIGVLGVEKGGEDWYQILLGGKPEAGGALGVLIGKAVRAEQAPQIIERLARHYLSVRLPGELFIGAVERLGAEAFRRALETEESVAA
ncbi:MAG TPA: nitrite/sulfite reductase [Vitreimonas sp.]|uniref:nitrite/sulfite reductase n=1 Tax=Vitreimonas sp. TaxID=3069702 RepID=UPI002D3696CA|nr:nitrite/sulfite reductase [Vitreimonas sp.]HYD86880.1 nitrite/sulfite reductase [Vitreimonas sp.]